MAESSPWIVDVTDATFEREVITRSSELPVVIDFWAPWCGPCRMLGPVLEKLAVEGAGKFLLAKVNVDESQGIAAELRVSSIPAVFAVRGGKLADQFVGVLPEDQLRAWLARLEPTPAEVLITAAADLEGENPQAAVAKLREAIELEPRERVAHIALARVLTSLGQLDDAEAEIAHLEADGFLEPEAERIKAQALLAQAAKLAGGLEAARAAATAAPTDMLAQLNLAYALAGLGQYREALDASLAVLQRDRKGQGEAARQLMVDVFHLLGPDDPLATEYRRKLSAALY